MIFDPNIVNQKPIKKPSGGLRANGLGSIHEKTITAALDHFYPDIKYNRHVHLCNSIYGSRLYNDFLVYGIPRFDDGLIIESKYQGSSGSADEKFPFLVANIKERFPFPCLIVYSLDGAKPKSVEWLLAQRDGVKLIEIIKYDKFPTRLHKEMLPYD